MKLLLPAALIVLMVCALVQLGGEVRAWLAVDGASRRIRESENQSPAEEEARARGAVIPGAASAEAFLHLGRVLRRRGEAAREMEERIGFFCEALGAMGEAVARAPRSAVALMSWASLRQLLGEVQCAEAHTAGSPGAVVDFALTADPANPGVAYAGALLAVWAGDRTRVPQLLQRFLSLTPKVSAGQQGFILSQLDSPESVLATVPARFPQIAEWSATLSERAPERFRRFSSALEGMQLAAIDEAESRYNRGEVPLDLIRQWYLRLERQAAGRAVERRLTEALAEVFARGGTQGVAAHYRERSALVKLDVLRAALKSDSRPRATPLTGWDARRVVTLDEFYGSVGFYVPRGSTVRMFEVSSAGPNTSILPSLIRVLVSDDNEQWEELGAGARIELAALPGRATLVVRPGEGDHRFWKVHYASSMRNRSFTNALSELVTVYGFDGLGEGA